MCMQSGLKEGACLEAGGGSSKKVMQDRITEKKESTDDFVLFTSQHGWGLDTGGGIIQIWVYTQILSLPKDYLAQQGSPSPLL